MRDNLIHVNPFQLLDILSVKGHQQINEHGYISFSGHIDQEQEKNCIAIAQQENPIIQVSITGENGEQLLIFAGVLTEMSIKVENQLRLLSATVRSGSYLMDLNPHIRSFQAPSLTYGKVINVLNKRYQGASVTMNVGNNEKIPGVILQYNETDWAFAKRMASRFNTVLVANNLSGRPFYDFGLHDHAPRVQIESKTYAISKNVGTYLYNQRNGVNGQSEMDMTYYLYKSREVYVLGECVSFNHQPLYISAIDTELEGAELYHTYTLAPKAGLQVPKQYNLEMIGNSLSGKITATQKAVVQVSIDKDENEEAGVRWLPYATVYSTPDGTGWYCMPEVGDSIRLYAPNEHDEQVYVASAVHLPLVSGPERSNPDFKSIMNKQRKEVLFTPETLLITNNNGMSIELSDQEGIKIVSDKAIKIRSDSSVDITSTSSTLTVTAPERLTFTQAGTQMDMQDKLLLKGAQVRLD